MSKPGEPDHTYLLQRIAELELRLDSLQRQYEGHVHYYEDKPGPDDMFEPHFTETPTEG